ncbi:type III pantothenate kinase [Mucilaginibacter gracilis]|uniref:Type III pantothenate kinase n=1 Tax=Mucilaginibacter gracilis TaxID=423350 RepID=A0A495IXT8_9SPHI|nr:type III pantothenate kinase [Mucilaginibacter gracilis]RKR81505.1 type III pantothenate kinase [Mucilaginibacter gracilis]
MANLVIDIGNTNIKLAVFNFDELSWVQSYKVVDEQVLNDILTGYKPDRAIISSVKKQYTETWEPYLSKHIPLVKFNADMAKLIKNHYRTPKTLGLDRLAAVAGAQALYPGKSSMVIDAGTCITYDWVDTDGSYFGGSISPGLQMRYKALSHYTGALPLLNADEHFTAHAGDDTQTAIHSGVQNGIRFEVEGFIAAYFKAQKPMNILLTGGDSIFFDTLLKNSIFAPHIKIEPYLVLSGLNAVIQQPND